MKGGVFKLKLEKTLDFDLLEEILSVINRKGSFVLHVAGDKMAQFGGNGDLERIVVRYGGASEDDTLYCEGVKLLNELFRQGVLRAENFMQRGKIMGVEEYESIFVRYFPNIIVTINSENELDVRFKNRKETTTLF